MDKEDVVQLTEALKGVIEVENKKLEQSLEMKIGNLEKHNKHHELLSKYDELFNDETLEVLRELALRAIKREEARKKFNDWAWKTVVGSITIGVLAFVYSVGKFVLANLSKIQF